MSPLKWCGKGSLLLPCPKMPFGIFLFLLKFDFQKSEGNGEKRRKPENISGFLVGIFFVKTHWRHHPDSDRGIKVLQTSALPLGYGAIFWSGRRDSDPRHSPWQGDALPLSHSRNYAIWCDRRDLNSHIKDTRS